MVFLVGGANSASDFEISNSLRFNDDDSASLTRTPSSAGNRRTFTFSTWVKRSKIGGQQTIFLAYGADNNLGYNALVFTTTGQLALLGWSANWLVSTALFLDPAAWYHIVLAVDTTDGTADDRVKLYVNGSQLTSFGTRNNPSQNDDFAINDDEEHNIGSRRAYDTSDDYFDGYLSETYLVDGSQLAPTLFGETDDNGIWVPIKYTGSYGTNGFKLEYKQTGTSANASGIGADTSGNTHHWTLNGLAATDVTTDTPSNNFATLNPLSKLNSPVTAEGNLEYDSNSSSGSSLVSTIAPSNGKWYVEVKALTSTIHIGVSEVGLKNFEGQGASRPNINYQYGGGVEIDGSIIDNEATFTTNDIIGLALNLDDGELIIYKNGTALNSGTAYNLHTNTTHGNTGFSVQTATGSGNTKASFNFGNPAFSISSGNADANGYGNFEYAVPTNYYALCTKNLAEYG